MKRLLKVVNVFIGIGIGVLTADAMALGKSTILVKRPTNPVASDLALSNYRMAILTNKGRALVLRNDNLQWQFISTAALKSGHILQRRSKFTTIPSEAGVTHDAVEDMPIINQLIPANFTINLRDTGLLGIQKSATPSLLFGGAAPQTTCQSATDLNDTTQYLGHCIHSAYQRPYLSPAVHVLYKGYNTIRVDTTTNTYGDSSASFSARVLELAQIHPLVVAVGGEGATWRQNLTINGSLKNDAPEDSWSPWWQVPKATGLFAVGSENSSMVYGGGRGAVFDLAYKAKPQSNNGASAVCFSMTLHSAYSDDVDSSDTASVFYPSLRQRSWITCELLAWGGTSRVLQNEIVETGAIDGLRHPLFNALLQDKVYMASVEGKRRSAFFSDRLNGVSYIFLHQGDEWSEVPIALDPDEEADILVEAIYELVPES